MMAEGTRLGPYEILSPLGAGGMGEVYRARDTKLGRDVALKILPDSFARDPERVARFKREAQMLAALNHPHIAAIYGLEEASGMQVLVLELVDGETLADRLRQCPLPLDEALAIARQIADALEAAHEKGIIHRDLKPANIALTEDGNVKVLDFGLAKATETASGVSFDLTNSPTITSPAMVTGVGVILGTAAYMSPEQARGKNVEKRADIWAFGLVLYEMLTGRQAFTGETTTDVLASVVKEEPRWDGVPRQVQRLLKSCLEKDPRKRLRDIGDAWRLLEEVAEPRPALTRHFWIPWAAAAMLALALGAALWAPWRNASPAPEVKRYQIAMNGDTGPPFVVSAVSPDGRHLAYMAWVLPRGWRLWIRSLDSLEARAVPGAEVTPVSGAPVYPFWSPDSQFIAFASAGKLRKVNISGGAPQTICDVSMSLTTAGSWSRDGVILVTDGGAILRVSDTGGTPSPVVAPHGAEKRGGFFPFFLPDGRHFLYYSSTGESASGYINVGSLDAKPETQDTKPLLAAAAAAIFVADPDHAAEFGLGHLLFRREGALYAQRFDARRLQLIGEAVPVADQVGSFIIFPLYSVSTNGVLIYHPGVPKAQSQLTRFDRKGNATGTLGDPAYVRDATFSPDGTRVALSIEDVAKSPPVDDLWISDLSRGFRTRLTFGAGSSRFPVWSADSSRIAFARDGKIYRKATDGTSEEEPLVSTGQSRPTSWSRDGRYLLYDVLGESQGSSDIWVLPLEGDPKPFPFLSTPAAESSGRFSSNGKFSPDGRWVAYVSNETGSPEIYVRPFPPSNRGLWLVSKGANTPPFWRQDGQELGYVTRDGSVMSVPVVANPVFHPGQPQVLFKRLPSAVALAPSPDRNLFLMSVPIDAAQSTPEPFTVVLNWTALLKK